MFLHSPTSLRALPKLSPLESAHTPSGAELFSARSFEWFLDRERSLADRGARTFGLLLADVGRARFRRPTPSEIDAFCERLLGEIRSTDVVGRLEGDRIGILLPESDADGVWGAEARLRDLAESCGLSFDAQGYAYPDAQAVSRVRRNGNAAAHPRAVAVESPAPSRTQDLWTLLSPPVPSWKRALDVVAAGFLLLLLLPLFVLVSVAIRFESPGPVFFRQKRVGRGGRLFDFYKFRSMHADAEARRTELEEQNEQAGPIFKMRDDPRITRIGRWIRRASIDELPQLWNVLRGDFSLVGPRPPTPDEVCRYELWQRRRLSVPGGLTCRWQVSGRSEIGFEDWMRLDMQYVSRRGWLEDLVLLVRTLPAVLSGRGAY